VARAKGTRRQRIAVGAGDVERRRHAEAGDDVVNLGRLRIVGRPVLAGTHGHGCQHADAVLAAAHVPPQGAPGVEAGDAGSVGALGEDEPDVPGDS
jgi:hypothetical protein